jgi:hypothetical protein
MVLVMVMIAKQVSREILKMNKQLTQKQNLRENVKELFNTLKEQNGLAWKEIVRNYKQQQEREKNVNRQTHNKDNWIKIRS